MLARLEKGLLAVAARARRRTIERLLSRPLPAGVAAERIARGIALSGRGLRMRFVLDPALRSFWR
jgi:hypothetical protein